MILRRVSECVMALAVCTLLMVVESNATTFTFDGTTDQSWEGANWNDGAPGQTANESTGTDAGLVPTGSSYDYANDDFFISNGSTVNGSNRITLQTGSLTVNNGSQLDITAAGDFSALNIGFGGGPTTVLFDGATVNLAGSGLSGRAVRVENNSTLTIQDSTLNVTSSGANDSIEVEGDSMLFVVNSALNMGHLRLDGGSAGLQFTSGSLTLGAGNPLRSSNSFSGEFNWVGAAGSGVVTHTNLSSNNNNLAGKTAQGFFSIDGVRVNPTLLNTIDWSNPANIAALNDELDDAVIGGRWLELRVNGSQQELHLIPEPGTGCLLCLACLAGIPSRRFR